MFTVVGYYAWYKFEQLSGALLIKHTRENYLSHFYYGENAMLNFQVFFFFCKSRGQPSPVSQRTSGN